MTNTVKQVMATRGINQRELCQRLGIGESHLNRILNGKMTPRVELATRIAAALGATVDELWPQPAEKV